MFSASRASEPLHV